MPDPTLPISRRSLVTLAVGILSVMSTAEGRTYSSARMIAPRNYYYSRTQDPFKGMVSDIFNMPIYFNSLIKQHSNAQDKVDHSWTPSYDIGEDAKTGCMELVMEVPGMTAKDLDIELENDSLLNIKGSRKTKRNGKVIEMSFEESFRLDEDADSERLDVSLAAGILKIHAPKKEKVVKRIPVIAADGHDDELEGGRAEVEAVSSLSGANEENTEIVDGLEISAARRKRKKYQK